MSREARNTCIFISIAVVALFVAWTLHRRGERECKARGGVYIANGGGVCVKGAP